MDFFREGVRSGNMASAARASMAPASRALATRDLRRQGLEPRPQKRRNGSNQASTSASGRASTA
jgi:hypothetical protein